MSHVNEFFKHYGQIMSIDLQQRKRTATVKFKDISSAEKAAAEAQIQAQNAWNEPSLKIIYTVGTPSVAPHKGQNLSLSHQNSTVSNTNPE